MLWLQGIQPMRVLKGSLLRRLAWSVRSNSPLGTPGFLQIQIWPTGLPGWRLSVFYNLVLALAMWMCRNVGLRYWPTLKSGEKNRPQSKCAKRCDCSPLECQHHSCLASFSLFSCTLQPAVPRLIILVKFQESCNLVCRVKCLDNNSKGGVTRFDVCMPL